MHRMEHGDIMRLARVEAIDEHIRKRYYPKPKPTRKKGKR